MSASVYINLAIQAFQRSNPIAEIANRVMYLLNFMVNYKSNIKLNKYRQNLYMQQLRRMEGFLSEGSPYTYRGEKIDRRF